ncbi:MAG: HAD family phosphatase [Planctomycetaceae bacterium]|nr:HAD family phosphatase [Planctomycetaceae bacterium]
MFGVLFDVDGVLVDSYAAHLHCWQLSCRRYGRDCTEEEFARAFGRTSREVIRETWENPPSDEEIRIFDEEKEALYRQTIADAFPHMPGARQLIHALAAEGIPMAIGSSAPPANVQVVIDQLGVADLITTVITGADVVRGKPDPDVFLQGARGIGIDPSRCIVLEDAPPGVEAALAAGAKCLGVVSRGRTREELYRAHGWVSDLSEVSPAMLRQIVDGNV